MKPVFLVFFLVFFISLCGYIYVAIIYSLNTFREMGRRLRNKNKYPQSDKFRQEIVDEAREDVLIAWGWPIMSIRWVIVVLGDVYRGFVSFLKGKP